jgi:outer membrane protein OmpA-like peptidoglycan-associated protein
LPPPPAPVPAPEATPVKAIEETPHESSPAWPDPPPISFKGDSKRLNREVRNRVEDLARLLRDHPELRLAIRGYTDERRTSERTLSLGQKRGEKIARYLQELGVDASRLHVESLPIDRSVEPDREDRSRATEDRVEFVIESRSERPIASSSSAGAGVVDGGGDGE